MSRRLIAILVVCVCVAALLVACGGGAKQQAEAGVSQAGEAVTVNDAVITLNSGSVSKNTVKANFTIENKGSADLAIDPKTSFLISAENEGEKVTMEVDPVSCKNTLIPSTVPAGGKVTGDVCWRSDPTLTWPATARINYDSAVWEVKVEE